MSSALPFGTPFSLDPSVFAAQSKAYAALMKEKSTVTSDDIPADRNRVELVQALGSGPVWGCCTGEGP